MKNTKIKERTPDAKLIDAKWQIKRTLTFKTEIFEKKCNQSLSVIIEKAPQNVVTSVIIERWPILLR